MLKRLELQVYRLLQQTTPHSDSPASPAPRQVLVICVSGGRDSMALLHVLHAISQSRLARKLATLSIHALHFNHEKRGEQSNLDAIFVLEACQRMGIPLRVERFSETGPTTVGNFQDTARCWRRERALIYLQQLTTEGREQANPCLANGWIVTAHHARDHAESLLLHLARGSGIDGLLGLTPCDPAQHLLRPFAETPYKEIVDYADQTGVTHREDASNAETDYRRNLVRHRLLPVLAELNPTYESALVRLSQNLRATLRSTSDTPAVKFPTTAVEVRALALASSKELAQILTKNSAENIAHHARLHLQNRKQSYCVPLGKTWEAVLENGALLFRNKC